MRSRSVFGRTRRSIGAAVLGGALLAGAHGATADPATRSELRLGEQKHLDHLAQPWGMRVRFKGKPLPLTLDLSLTANMYFDAEHHPRATQFFGTGVLFFHVEDPVAVSRPQAAPNAAQFGAELLVERIDDVDAMLRSASERRSAINPGTGAKPAVDLAALTTDKRLILMNDEVQKRLPEAMAQHHETLTSTPAALERSALAVVVRLGRGITLEPRRPVKPPAVAKPLPPDAFPGIVLRYAFTQSGVKRTGESLILAVDSEIFHFRISGAPDTARWASAVVAASFSGKPRGKGTCVLKMVETMDTDKSDPSTRNRYLALNGPCNLVLDADERRAAGRNFLVHSIDDAGRTAATYSLYVQNVVTKTVAAEVEARRKADLGRVETEREWVAPTGARHVGTAFSAPGPDGAEGMPVAWFVVQLGDSVWSFRAEAFEGAAAASPPAFPWTELAYNAFDHAR